jgi:hypothetical protein
MVWGEREGFQSIRFGRTKGMLHPHKKGINKKEKIQRRRTIREPIFGFLSLVIPAKAGIHIFL